MASNAVFSQSSASTSAYSRHLQRADAYVRFYGGAPPSPSAFRTEREIVEQNHRFIRDDERDIDGTDSEEKQLAKKYYDSLFREYALVDLSRWREHRVAMRWRTKAEVLAGTGQFTCGSLTCSTRERGVVTPNERSRNEQEDLKTFELNFGYVEEGKKKNALVKVCVCRKCARKLRKAHEDISSEKAKSHRHRRRSRSIRSRSRSPSRRDTKDGGP